jgi:dTDP-4-dehydrorhamnose reductase
MKLLISGASGQLGLALTRRLHAEHEVVALDRNGFDLADGRRCRETLALIRPDALLNCAAYTAVDRAESESELARVINAEGPRHLAQSCVELGIFPIHFSTDYVFDGCANQPYAESHPTAPASVYGRTKLDGETAIAAISPDHLIFRLSWVYGNNGANFYKTMLRLAQERPLLRVVGDQAGVPNFTADLSDSLAQVLARPVKELRRLSGLYHVSSQGQTTWCEFASAIVEGAGLQNRVAVQAIKTSEYPTAALRPAYSVLDASRFAATFGCALPHWHDGLSRCLAERALTE